MNPERVTLLRPIIIICRSHAGAWERDRFFRSVQNDAGGFSLMHSHAGAWERDKNHYRFVAFSINNANDLVGLQWLQF